MKPTIRRQFLAALTITVICGCALPLPAYGNEGRAAATAATPVEIPVPADPTSARPLLLCMVWITVTAAILGPLIQHYHLLPRVTQVFSDDRRNRQ